MSDIQDQQLNLEYLEEIYFGKSNAREADEILRRIRGGKASIDLFHLLRDHRRERISDAETFQRDAFDFLLAYYDILEIACLIGYVPEPLPTEIAATALVNLNEPALIRYYEEFYPILLPTLFRLRLEGKWTIHEKSGLAPSSHELFNEFLGLVNLQRNDHAMDTFLWFLDDGWTDKYSIKDTLLELRNPAEIVERFLKPPPDRNALDLSLRGLQNFLTFCIELDDLLRRSASFPLLQSAQWYYYSYWFQCIQEKVGHTIDTVIAEVKQWSPKRKKADKFEAKQEIEKYVSAVEYALKRLLSGGYGEALGKRSQELQAAVRVVSPAERPATAETPSAQLARPARVPNEVAMKIRPLNDRVVVHRMAAAEKTSGGMLLPDSAKERPQKGRVLAVGDGRLLKDGSRQRLQIKEGDVVIFSVHAGEVVKVALGHEVKEDVLLMREDDILAILE